MTIVALHGFLGRPQFWDKTVQELEKDEEVACYIPDLYKDSEFRERSWISWPDQLERWLERQQVDGPIVLMGYSMGGRLALEFARRRANRISHLILISTRGAMEDEGELKERSHWEEAWLKRFQNEEPSEWCKDWNAQSVFEKTQDVGVESPEGLTREQICDSFEAWSVTSQVGEWQDLQAIEAPTLWLFGENDKKYLKLMEQTLQAQPRAQSVIVGGAGHRIPLDQPALMVEHIKTFYLKGES